MSAYCHRNMRMSVPLLLLHLCFLILFLFFLVGIAKAELKQFPPMTIYQCYTSDNLTVAWDNSTAELTEFYFFNIGEQRKYLTGTTNSGTLSFKLPKTGLYSFYLRFKLVDGSYTEWVNSEDSELAQIIPIGQSQYTPGAWIIYGHIAPPSGGGVVSMTREGVIKVRAE
jgi:hypothetical protein